jgi:hypothetical protein
LAKEIETTTLLKGQLNGAHEVIKDYAKKSVK